MTGRLEIGDWSFILEGRAASPPLPTDWHPADWQVVSPGYFETMEMPVLQGRGIEHGDRTGAPNMMVVNRTLARQVWPDGNVVGQRVLLGGGGADSVWRTVVGIVGDVRHRGLSAEPRPEMYLPYAQFPGRHRSRARDHVAGAAHGGRPEDAGRTASRGASLRWTRTCRWRTCRRWRSRWAAGPPSGGW